jgi:3D (Asp-Asp-Asp) domain-containing protein
LVKGTRRIIPPLILNAKRKVKKVLTMIATAYSDSVISCGRWAGHPTPIGLKARYGVIAVDPKVIPLRTKLYVEGYGYGIAGDVGGAIKGNRIDLCFDTHREAVNYGRKKVKVYILE